MNFQHKKFSNLEKNYAELTSKYNSNISKTAELTNENSNLKKAVTTLQEQIVNESSNEVVFTPEPKSGAKLTINEIGRQSITVPANEFHGPLSTEYYALNVSIFNQSESNQTYDRDSFYAITENGLIVRPSSFGPGIEQTVWNRSEIAPAGNVDVVVLFPSDQRLVTLTLTDPSTKQQISAALPAVSN